MEPPPVRPNSVGWFCQAGLRALKWWPAKMFGTTLGMGLFFVGYFWVLRHPASPVTVMPLTRMDRLVGFHAGALPLYLSLWLYVSLVPALLVDRRELVAYVLAAGALSLAGLTLFYLWPTTAPKAGIDWSQHPSLAFLQSVDASGNACPSLHVAFAVFTAVWLERLLQQMGAGRLGHMLNGLWVLGILYSTVAIRQHVVLDVLAGAGLGLGVAAANLRMLRRFA